MANEAAAFHPRGESGAFLPATDRRQLTERQAAFVRSYVENGGNGAAAARDAGYSEHSAKQIGTQMLSLPWVQRAIEVARGRCLAELEVKSLRVLRGILDETNPLSIGQQLKAAEIVLKIRAGDRALDKKAEQSKALNEMSNDELQDVIRRGQAAARAAADAAQPVLEGRSEPITSGDNPKPIDPVAESTV